MRFQNGCHKVVIERCVVKLYCEIMLVIANRTRAARLLNFEITPMISGRIEIHSVQILLVILQMMMQMIPAISYLKHFCGRNSSLKRPPKQPEEVVCGRFVAKQLRTTTRLYRGYYPVESSLRTQTYFRSSLLSTRKVTFANPNGGGAAIHRLRPFNFEWTIHRARSCEKSRELAFWF